MTERTDPLPQLRHAPIRHNFRRLEDYICWTQPLFKKVDYDQLDPQTAFHSSHRSIGLGAINLTRSHYNGGIRLTSLMEDHVLFTFNSSGSVVFQADKRQKAPPPGRGVLMVTPTEGHYMRRTGGGILLSTSPGALVQTAHAIQGPLAAKRLRQRLQEPLQFFDYGSPAERSLPRSLMQSLHLVDSLLSPQGSVPATLRLDDLICRQLVLMICPEIMSDEESSMPVLANGGFDGLLEWMISRVAEPLSLSQLEAQSGYSRRALQRAFQNRFGCGPMQWLRRRRLDLALEQLTQANAGTSVSAIAQRCGYLSLASFSRDFSSAYGRKPSEILRANQQQAGPMQADQS
ncbi:MAG: AraC family transcriptional regulator [Cyanobacteriota bacterium]|nr:AraC family transcriptional regulator [Cyanobacteriota bacterium]